MKGHPMTTSTVRRGRYAVAALAAVAAIAAILVALAQPGRPAGRAFPRLHPAAAPAGWTRTALPNGTAVLSYPPTLHPIAGDKGTVSAAQVGPAGTFQLYLNATPQRVRFRGGTGSCVIDDYTTRVGAHHFQEIACLVRGRHNGSVIVAAAPVAT